MEIIVNNKVNISLPTTTVFDKAATEPWISQWFGSFPKTREIITLLRVTLLYTLLPTFSFDFLCVFGIFKRII